MAKIICLMVIMFQNIGFGILALVAELNGASWLAIIFVILEFLTLSTPVLKKVENKLEGEE